MRRFFLLLFLLLLSLGILRPQWWHRVHLLVDEWKKEREEIAENNIPDSRIGISYVLDEKRWTTFPLPRVGTVIRSLSMANFHPGLKNLSAEGETYALEYQVLDREGRVIKSNVYHYRVPQVQYVDSQTGEPFRFTFYPDSDLIPSPATAVMIHMGALRNPEKIRFRIAEKSGAVADVSIQLYMPEQTAERKLRYLWQRLSNEKRILLARGNVYPEALLTEQERKNLLRNLWRPLSPLGVEHIDYVRRLIYIVKDTENIEEEMDEPVLRPGLFIDPAHRGIVPIPQRGGRVRLEFFLLQDRAGFSPSGRLRIRWYGLRPHERAAFRWSLSDISEGRHFQRNLPGGILEIETPFPLVVRAFLQNGEETSEITPEPMIVQGFLIQPGLPVLFPIHNLTSKQIPFRADFRRLTIDPVPTEVKYAVEEGPGEIIGSGSLKVEKEISLYDRLTGDLTGIAVSEPISHYFFLPPNARYLRFTSDQPVLVTGYNRPPGLTKTTRVPEDYYKDNLDEEIRQPSWFSFYPVDYDRLLLTNRVVNLSVQSRPPEDRPLLVAGRYEWEDFHPHGDWRARYLLTPIDPDQVVRAAALDATYRPLGPGKEMVLRFSGIKGMKRLRPGLIYEKKGDAPAAFTLHVDDHPFFSTRIAGKRGEISLPPLTTGLHNVRMESESGDIRFYINHVAPADDSSAPLYLKRLANYLDSDGLRFVYTKKKGEKHLLSLRLYVPRGKKDPSIIRVSVGGKRSKGIGPYADWSLMERQYIIRPDAGERVPVLGTADQNVDGGRLFFLGLGADLPAGQYPLKIEPVGDFSGGYLILSEVTPGLFEKREWYQEATEKRW